MFTKSVRLKSESEQDALVFIIDGRREDVKGGDDVGICKREHPGLDIFPNLLFDSHRRHIRLL